MLMNLRTAGMAVEDGPRLGAHSAAALDGGRWHDTNQRPAPVKAVGHPTDSDLAERRTASASASWITEST